MRGDHTWQLNGSTDDEFIIVTGEGQPMRGSHCGARTTCRCERSALRLKLIFKLYD